MSTFKPMFEHVFIVIQHPLLINIHQVELPTYIEHVCIVMQHPL